MIVTKLLSGVFSFFTSVYFLGFLGVLLLVLVLAYLYLTRNFGKWEKKYGFPGLKPVPFFGTEHDMLFSGKSMQEITLERYKAFDGHKLGIIYQGSRPTILVRDFEFLKTICIKDFDHFSDFFSEGMDKIVDSNIFFMTGETWRKSKMALAQVFRMKYVKDVVPKMNYCIKRSLSQLDSFAKTGESFKIDETVIEPCLLDCVGHVVCGVQIDAAKDPDSEFCQMVKLLQSSIWRFVLFNVAPELMEFLGIKVFYPKSSNYLEKLLKELMAEHRRTKKYDDMMGVHLKVQEEVERKKSELLATGEYLPLTDEMIVSSCMQFFFDGVVTIATMIDVALYYLAENPALQEKAYEEIQNVLGDRMTSDSGNINDLADITDEDLMEMKYIEQIFTEASRIGAFPFIGRTCTKDYPIKGTNFTVPKGTPVFIPILGYHMDPKLFPDPEKFDPDRFAPENKDNVATGTLIPFGQGPRMCLGKNFIRMEGRCYLANIIRLYRVLPSEKTAKKLEWDAENPGRIKGGLWLKIERRDY